MNRTQLLNALIDRYGYSSYLEINNHHSVAVCGRVGIDRHNDLMISANSFFRVCDNKFDIIFISVCCDVIRAYELLNYCGCLMLVSDALCNVDQLANVLIINADEPIGLIFKQSESKKHIRVVGIDELLPLLPAVINHRNIWVTSRGVWGRIGHQFNDILSGLIISKLFGLRYYYSGFTGDHAKINEYLNLADFFDQLGCPENPVMQITTCLNVEKWAGMSLALLRKHLRVVPPNTNVVFTESTYFQIRQLYCAERNGDVFPGMYTQILDLLRSIIPHTRLYREFNSDFDKLVPSQLNVAIYVRAGGSIRDNTGREATKSEYDQIIRRIQADYPDKRLNIVYYTQGPLSDLVGDFSGCDVRICDEEYPRLYAVIKTLLTADVFVTGLSSFSNVISIFRTKPTYCSVRNPLVMPQIDILV